jgi:hypothetical protein
MLVKGTADTYNPGGKNCAMPPNTMNTPTAKFTIRLHHVSSTIVRARMLRYRPVRVLAMHCSRMRSKQDKTTLIANKATIGQEIGVQDV